MTKLIKVAEIKNHAYYRRYVIKKEPVENPDFYVVELYEGGEVSRTRIMDETDVLQLIGSVFDEDDITVLFHEESPLKEAFAKVL